MEYWVTRVGNVLSQVGYAVLTFEEIVFFAGAVLGALAMGALVWTVCSVAANIKIFQKAGERGWKSFIPIYNHYITYKISWKPLWFWINALLVVASAVLRHYSGHSVVVDGAALAVGAAAALLYAASQYHLAKAFGHGVPFTLGLLALHPIFILILGLGGSQYQGTGRAETGASAGAPFEAK